jgi:hypothetical protein
MATAFTYSDLEMSRVDAELQRNRELLVVLSPDQARILIGLIEASRGLAQRLPLLARLRLLLSGLCATFRATLFHARLLDLSRVLVYFSASATWSIRSDGQFEFRFAR